MRTKRTPWTFEQKADFRKWHEERLSELGYVDKTLKELRVAREKWLLSIPLLKVN